MIKYFYYIVFFVILGLSIYFGNLIGDSGLGIWMALGCLISGIYVSTKELYVGED